MPDKEKMSYAKFIDFLEKNDPTGLSQSYYKTLVGKYEKTLANEGFVEADKKALNYIKNNDPTGFIKHYYENTDLGKADVRLNKQIDETLDNLDKQADRFYKNFSKMIKDDFSSLKDFITGHDHKDNNKTLPIAKSKNAVGINNPEETYQGR